MTAIQKFNKNLGVKYWRIWSGLRIYYTDLDNENNTSAHCIGLKDNKNKKYLYMFATKEMRKNCLWIWYDMSCLLNSVNEPAVFIYFCERRCAARILLDKSVKDEMKYEPVNVQKIVYESIYQVDQEIKIPQTA